VDQISAAKRRFLAISASVLLESGFAAGGFSFPFSTGLFCLFGPLPFMLLPMLLAPPFGTCSVVRWSAGTGE
jgi:hypothetical protein